MNSSVHYGTIKKGKDKMLKRSKLNHWEGQSKHMGNMKLVPIRLP